MLPSLTFCNDIDFSDWQTYQEVHRILLEEFGIVTTDSFWLFAPAGSDMALFKSNCQEKGPKHDELLEEILAGRLNILHSAGNFSQTDTSVRSSRGMISEALQYLSDHARIPQIWTNHGDIGDIQNIGGSSPYYQEGDLPSSETYIVDLLLHYGVRFFWLDYHCSNTFVFERADTGNNPLWSLETTRSGHQIRCFRRFRGALPKAPTALTLGDQLSASNLEALATSDRGVTIIYQHWCAHRDASGKAIVAGRPIFPETAMLGLKQLVKLREQQRIALMPLEELLNQCASAL
ncbi:hypothetical protein BST81_21200 [Leptolyngbya sp. 'hensonii']|uniref:hypothetical protein n=1 Tax=Leptolyngbya sp. 'hensonii' TaxID=1922337 RepID=UPI00094FEA0D|nr:hypothetical protein [Leptolyngbya sp. 'hensonii']OLP16497.1 hypothetical protein BST81_21200 [Leptolyngbya sp. 'hensonii']